MQSCDSVGTVHILLPVGFTTVTLLQKSNAARARCVRGPIQRTRLFMVLPKLLYVVESAQSFWPPLQLLVNLIFLLNFALAAFSNQKHLSLGRSPDMESSITVPSRL